MYCQVSDRAKTFCQINFIFIETREKSWPTTWRSTVGSDAKTKRFFRFNWNVKRKKRTIFRAFARIQVKRERLLLFIFTQSTQNSFFACFFMYCTPRRSFCVLLFLFFNILLFWMFLAESCCVLHALFSMTFVLYIRNECVVAAWPHTHVN